jgi:hypothetical protein
MITCDVIKLTGKHSGYQTVVNTIGASKRDRKVMPQEHNRQTFEEIATPTNVVATVSINNDRLIISSLIEQSNVLSHNTTS